MKAKMLIMIALLSLVLISEASCTAKQNGKCPSQKELNELTLILTKYGNNPVGVPPLHYAVIKKDVKAVNLLLKHGADPIARDSNKKSCLYHAIITENIPLVKKFIELGDNPFNLNDVNENSYTALNALNISIMYGQPEVAKYLLERKYFNNKVLDHAFFSLLSHPSTRFPKDRRREMVLIFMSHGLDLNSTEVQGRTHLQQFLLAHSEDREMADFLRGLGAK